VRNGAASFDAKLTKGRLIPPPAVKNLPVTEMPIIPGIAKVLAISRCGSPARTTNQLCMSSLFSSAQGRMISRANFFEDFSGLFIFL
jgi:hypothetical protein